MSKSNGKARKKRVIKWTNILLVIGVFVLIGTMGYTAFKDTRPAESDLSYIDFMDKVNAGEVEKADIVKDEDSFKVYMKDGTEHQVVNPGNEEFKKELLEKGVTLQVRKRTAENAITSTIVSVPTIVIMFAICIMVFKYMGGTANTIFKVLKNENAITFEDVAGMDDIKKEVQFAVDTLKNYKELYKAGARPTKGIILEGPPGTGKTLIAKAIAGEAKVPFISTSGSDFIEMFAGLGASRVRALWELAITNAPCVIFIDEIDAVGRRRQSANSGAQMESNQTLNALLQKMDGLSGDSGILVVAATNMVEDLDPALLRPGRFDKKIYIGAPKFKKDRDAIIGVHIRNKKLSEGLTVEDISKLMFGLTGAEIESSLNEAVIISIQRGRKGIISFEDIDEAVMKLRVNGVIVNNYTEHDKYVAAVHEAGHAIMNRIVGKKVSKVSIVAYSSGVGGVTVSDIDEEMTQFRTKTDFIKDVKILLAGMVAERIVFGENSLGCSNDLERATSICKSMIGLWGMSEDFIISIKTFYNDKMAVGDSNTIMDMVNKLELSILNETSYLLQKHEKELRTLADELVEKETVINFDLEL